MCANPTENQLQAEAPVQQRPTRAIQTKFAGPQKDQEVVKVISPLPPLSQTHTIIDTHACIHIYSHCIQVMVFKGASGKEAVIRAITYDLLFNNMKSIVVNTASKCTTLPLSHTHKT